jgi:Flp pilus assembly protein TadB
MMEEESVNKKAKKDNESFVRWQKYTIDQHTYAVNLILTLSTASLGFAMSLFVSKDFPLSSSRFCSCGVFLFTVSIFALLVSMGTGVYCVINRLLGFRMTKETARQREEGTSPEKLELLRSKYKVYDHRTWGIFWWQIGSFAFAVLTLISSIILIYWQKLL